MASRDEQSEEFLNSDALNDEFFNSIVERRLNITRDKFKIRLVMFSPAIGNNENFVSVLYRAKIKIEMNDTKEHKTVDTIIKALLSTLEELKKFSVFPRERFIYEEIIGNFENMWMERANEVVELGPKCLKFETDPYEIIVLDDLKAHGYQMLDRKVGLTASQAKAALTKLAKFHAAGAVRYVKDGPLQDFLVRKNMLPPEGFSEETEMGRSFKKTFTSFVDCVRSYGDCDAYADKLEKWNTNKLLNCWVDSAEPMKCGFTVLAHGDFWLNNMMFKLDESNEPIDVLMLDFQGCGWSNPCMDLHYFITSSVNNEDKIRCYDEILTHYYRELVESLNKLNYDQHIPTLEEFHEDLLEKSAMAVQSLFFILFVVKNNSPEVIDIGEIFKNENMEPAFYERIYCNENFMAALKSWFPFYDQRGYLDRLQ